MLERIVFVTIIFVLAYVILSDWQGRKALQENLDYYQSTYLHKSGWNKRFGNYQLFSNDGGKYWYIIEDGKIIGLANDVRPGLVEHVLAFDALREYVKRNGSITGNDGQGLRLLEDAGFEVVLESKE